MITKIYQINKYNIDNVLINRNAILPVPLIHTLNLRKNFINEELGLVVMWSMLLDF